MTSQFMRRFVCGAVMIVLTVGLTACDDGFEPVSKREAPADDTARQAANLDDQSDTPNVDNDEASKKFVEPEPWPAREKRWQLGTDYRFTDQSGQAIRLSDLKGRPLVISYFFTHCNNPEMCPKIVTEFAKMQRLADEVDLKDKVWFILVSFDPGRDTPELLTQTAEGRGFRFDNGRMLIPNTQQFSEFKEEYAVRAGRMGAGGQINHKVDLRVLDHEFGEVRNIGGFWKNEDIIDDLKRLVEEQAAAVPKAETVQNKVDDDRPLTSP